MDPENKHVVIPETQSTANGGYYRWHNARIAELERKLAKARDAAGMPPRCPNCGDVVCPSYYTLNKWAIDCISCAYGTEKHVPVEGAWREHFVKCRGAEK